MFTGRHIDVCIVICLIILRITLEYAIALAPLIATIIFIYMVYVCPPEAACGV